MADPVPAITEAEAVGDTAALYSDIRRVLAADVVNLIWRHLATIPGALSWAWATLRPAYLDGAIRRSAEQLSANLVLPTTPDMSEDLLAAAGLNSDQVDATRNILASYAGTNAMAIIALTALLLRIDDPAHQELPPPSPAVEPPTAHPLPTLPDLAALPSATANLVRSLNRLGATEPDPIIASMYRHLAHTPPYLALAWTLLAPPAQDGRLAAAIEAARHQVHSRAVRLAHRLHLPEPRPSPAAQAQVRTALTRFTGDVIARMLVVCATLEHATRPGRLPPPSPP